MYPASFEDLNLMGIPYLKKKFKCRVGFSDHSKGSLCTYSYCLGAVIEKHVKLNKNDKSLDSEFSITVKEFKELIDKANDVKKTMGKRFFLTNSEKYEIKKKKSNSY